MSFMENMDVEFKRQIVESLKKEVIAFANSEGGTVYIGVDDDGSVVGIDDTDDTMLRATQMIRDSIKPDVLPFVHIQSVKMDKKSVVEIRVSVGTDRPYYLEKEGLRPKGVYVRKGSSSHPLSDKGIRDMIRETSGKSYEEGRSLNQDLTFSTLKEEFKERSTDFGKSQMQTLRIVSEDGLYTNLGLLLSDQCQHTIKIAVFQGTDNATFRDRKEFSGSLLQQLNAAYEYIDRYNKTEAHFDGLIRNDTRDYPVEAVREALLNSIIHRDYSFSGSTVINLFDDHIEFISLGGLVTGLSMEAVLMGVSQSRNPYLAAVFYRMRLVESYGTGIRKIMGLYEKNLVQPVFKAAEGGFTVSLPNANEIVQNKREMVKNDSIDADVIEYVRQKGRVTRKEIEQQFSIKQTKAFKVLTALMDKGYIEQKKNGRLTVYVPKESRA